MWRGKIKDCRVIRLFQIILMLKNVVWRRVIGTPIICLGYFTPEGCFRYLLLSLPGGLYVQGHSPCVQALRRYSRGFLPKIGNAVFQTNSSVWNVARALYSNKIDYPKGVVFDDDTSSSNSSGGGNFTLFLIFISLLVFWVGEIFGPVVGFFWANVGFEYFMLYLSL